MTANAAAKQNTVPNIPFIDLEAQRLSIADKIDAAVIKAVHAGQYIMGPEVKELEKQLAAFSGVKHCLSCSNGTDALGLVLRAKNVTAGQAVFVPSFTFVATAEVVAWLGATPFFVDVEEDSFNLCPHSLEQAISDAKAQGLEPVGIIPVDLFGQPADYRKINPTAKKNGLWVMADAAQGYGGTLDGKQAGSMTDVTTTSFFPAKPLGCYGDGGAIFTDDDELANVLESLRVHGKGEDKYDNIRIGVNGRLDTVQAAILLEKLAIFPAEIVARQKVADRYTAALKDIVKTPVMTDGATSSWAQYTLILPEGCDRKAFMAACKEADVPTMVYYPIPLSQQGAYKHYPVVGNGTPVSEKLAQTVVSLPMHPYLSEETQDYIIDVVKGALA